MMYSFDDLRELYLLFMWVFGLLWLSPSLWCFQPLFTWSQVWIPC